MDSGKIKGYKGHYEVEREIPAKAADVFAFIDDHTNFSSHMNESSWVMGGGRMDTSIDAGGGQKVGSHIKMGGKVLWVNLQLDEVVTLHEPPRIKEWETVGRPNLIVIGHYRIRVEVEPQKEFSRLRVSIDYDLPEKNRWIGSLFGGAYAAWCVKQMTETTRKRFSSKSA